MANELVDILKRFNRKERYWVINTAFKDQVAHLHPKFWELLQGALEGKLDSVKREDAWWALDYHLDWLIGAFYAYTSGELVRGKPHGNSRNGLRLVMGQQEDIDFVVAVGTTVILIEAKAYGPWSNSQLDSKLQRLAVLQEIAIQSASPLNLHFVLMSRGAPSKLRNVASWPKWALGTNGTPIHIDLDVDSAGDLWTIGVCDSDGTSGKSGDHFNIRVVQRGAHLPVRPSAP